MSLCCSYRLAAAATRPGDSRRGFVASRSACTDARQASATGAISTCGGPSLAIGRFLSRAEYPIPLKSSMVKRDMNSNSAGSGAPDVDATREPDVSVSIDSLGLAQPRTDPAHLRWRRTWGPEVGQVGSELSMRSPREVPRFSGEALASYVGGPNGLRSRELASDEGDLLLVEGSSTITNLSGSGIRGGVVPQLWGPERSRGKPIPPGKPIP